MATMKQRLVIPRIMENHGNVSKSMREVGYNEATAKNPKNLTESKGFLELCDDIGLTDEFLTKALHDDIKGKPKRREKELRLAFQVKKRLTNDSEGGGGTTNNYLTIIGGDQAKRIARRVLIDNTESEAISDRLRDSDES